MSILLGELCFKKGMPKPVSTWVYFDRAQVRLKAPVSDDDLKSLRESSGYVYYEYNPARFDFSYLYRLEVHQPSEAALKWAAGRADALANRADFAIEWVLRNKEERDEFREFINALKARRWHSAKYGVRVVDGESNTTYDAPRGARTCVATYDDPVSRISGELWVYRLEWRSIGVRALSRCGVQSAKSFLSFDHKAFWQERLLLFQPDKEKIGRCLRNRRDRTKRRQSKADNEIRLDRRWGHALLNSVKSVQEMIDRYEKPFRIKRALERMDVVSLLPRGERRVGDSA